MPEGHYVAAVSPEDVEWERVGLIEALYDGITTRALDALGVKAGWRCMDVGAGRGSIARWLAERVGTGIAMYRAMEMTFWLPQTEATLAQVEGR